MRGSETDVSLLKLTKLERPGKRYDNMVLTITEKGNLSLNGKLRQKIQEDDGHVRVNIWITEDLKIVAIKKEENPNFIFPKNGVMKYPELLCKLSKIGYRIPAQYIVEWNEKANMWIGVLQEIPEAPKLMKRGGRK